MHSSSCSLGSAFLSALFYGYYLPYSGWTDSLRASPRRSNLCSIVAYTSVISLGLQPDCSPLLYIPHVRTSPSTGMYSHCHFFLPRGSRSHVKSRYVEITPRQRLIDSRALLPCRMGMDTPSKSALAILMGAGYICKWSRPSVGPRITPINVPRARPHRARAPPSVHALPHLESRQPIMSRYARVCADPPLAAAPRPRSPGVLGKPGPE